MNRVSGKKKKIRDSLYTMRLVEQNCDLMIHTKLINYNIKV